MTLRKIMLIAFALALTATGATLYAAQPHFIHSTTPFLVRQHSQTDPLGDITLTCDVAGIFAPQSAIRVDLSDPTTSIVNSTGGLFKVASNTSGQTGSRIAYAESEFPFDNPTFPILPGRVTSNAVTAITIVDMKRIVSGTSNFILIQVSGSADVGDVIRISGVRVDVAKLAGATINQIFETVTAVPPGSFVIDNSNTLQIAQIFDEISVSLTPGTLVQCLPGTTIGTVTITEKLINALTTRTQEDTPLFTPLTTCPGPATCTGPAVVIPASGTQIKVTINNVAPGVTVTACGTFASGTLTIVSSGTCTFSVASTATSPGGPFTFTYVVTADSLSLLESIGIPFTFTSVTPTPISPPPSATAQVQLAPNTITPGTFIGEQSASTMISFVPNPLPATPGTILNLNQCRSNLLCKFLSTVSGTTIPGGAYDTGIAIANTSRDIWFPSNTSSSLSGASPQSGVCRVHLFGTGGTIAANPSTTPTLTTDVITAGTDRVIQLSNSTFASTPVGNGFAGYAIIQCDFQFAHAEIIVADRLFSTFSHGYDCLVIPDPAITGGRRANDSSLAATGAGEGLSEKRAH